MAAPSSIEITGPLSELELPPVCANCGNATSESLLVQKVFRRVDNHESAPDTFVIAGAMVPFCPPCTAQHQSEVRVLTPGRRFRMFLRGNSSRSALAFTPILLLVVYAALLRSPHGSLLIWGVAAVLAGIMALCVWAGLRETEYLAVPPLTSVTSAFDFTDSHAQMFEREHRTVILRNPIFAEAFRARNAAHVWNSDDPINRRAARTRNLVINIAVAAVILCLAWMILRSFW